MSLGELYRAGVRVGTDKAADYDLSKPPLYQGLMQWRTQELVTAYGWQNPAVFRGPSGERVPWLPFTYAYNMLKEQATLIEKWRHAGKTPEATMLGTMLKNLNVLIGTLFVDTDPEGLYYEPQEQRTRDPAPVQFNMASLEPAPPDVENNPVVWREPPWQTGTAAPRRVLPSDAYVLTPKATWTFLDAAWRLAIHFDALSGQPSQRAILWNSIKEAAHDLPQTLLQPVKDAAEKAGEWVKPLLIVLGVGGAAWLGFTLLGRGTTVNVAGRG